MLRANRLRALDGLEPSRRVGPRIGFTECTGGWARWASCQPATLSSRPRVGWGVDTTLWPRAFATQLQPPNPLFENPQEYLYYSLKCN